MTPQSTLDPVALTPLMGPTQCPRCRTRYEIGAPQLEAADGWVRCGSCTQVFFAPACLSPQFDAHQSPKQVWPAQATKAREIANLEQQLERLSAQSQAQLGPGPVPKQDPTSDPAQQDTHAKSNPALNPAPNDKPSNAKPAPDQGLKPAFLYGLVAALALVMLLSIAAFEIYRARHVLAAMWPELKPTLLSFCKPLSCTLETPHDLQAISIESSALDPNPAEPHHFLLSLKLRNHNAYPVALPGVKLVVLNGLDEVVFQQSIELSKSGNSGVIEAGVITPERVSVVMSESLPDQLVSAYRVELIDPP